MARRRRYDLGVKIQQRTVLMAIRCPTSLAKVCMGFVPIQGPNPTNPLAAKHPSDYLNGLHPSSYIRMCIVQS
eukprot:scaffold262152_cov19-Prasinocladus_malaysianus.AAC.1